jgi:mono/diheme cytochrome c family protein
VACLIAVCASAAVPPGNAERGRELFRTQSCITCHNVGGQGGTTAPDLARSIAQDSAPSQMAALMWNHAPAMWAALEKQGIRKPQLTDQQASDLLAYFYSVRYFEKPGDAARGKSLFASKRCGDCHGISSAVSGGAKSVSEWQGLRDPIALAQQMWNHSADMSAMMAQKRIQRPQVTAQEMTDLLVYVQNLPETRGRQAVFTTASAETGERLFDLKGCAGCHTGALAIKNRPVRSSLTDFAAAMWNHASRMKQPPTDLNYEEMRRLVGYLFSVRFFEERGDQARGRRVFTSKNCASCHDNVSSGAPALTALAGSASSATMVSTLWRHGPDMLNRMQREKMAWPAFQGAEMADLIAYLNSRKTVGR